MPLPSLSAFCAILGAHCTPDAIRAGTDDCFRCAQVAGIDRLINESHRCVAHYAEHAPRMIADRLPSSCLRSDCCHPCLFRQSVRSPEPGKIGDDEAGSRWPWIFFGNIFKFAKHMHLSGVRSAAAGKTMLSEAGLKACIFRPTRCQRQVGRCQSKRPNELGRETRG